MKQGKNHPLYDYLILYLDLDKEILETRLRSRLDEMFRKGFIKEAKALLDEGIFLNVIGYRELNAYFRAEITFEQAYELIIIASRKLAKRQKTWFKNQMQIIMLDALDVHLVDKVDELTRKFLDQK